MANLVGAQDAWVPFPHDYDPGDAADEIRWPGSVWMSDTRQVRFGPADVVASAVERSLWLREWMPVAPIDHVDDQWLVTLPSGHPAHRPDLQPVPDQVPGLVGEALRRMHDLDVEPCSFSAGWEVQHATIAAAVDAGRLDITALPAPYDRYGADRLLELLVEGRPDTATIVVCHGAPALSNLWFDQGQLSATTGHHRLGLADPHLDLAVAHRSLQSWFGGEAVFGFYEGYGSDPDLVRLDHYVLIDVLLQAITTASVASP